MEPLFQKAAFIYLVEVCPDVTTHAGNQIYGELVRSIRPHIQSTALQPLIEIGHWLWAGDNAILS